MRRVELKNRNARPARAALVALVAVGLGFVGAGCGSDGTPTGVELAASGDGVAAGGIFGQGDDWQVLASERVDPSGGETVVAGGRYSLTIPAGAVAAPVVVTIFEAANGYLDFRVDPEGLPLLEPARLVIDYSGTPLDPSHPWYEGPEKELWALTLDGEPIEQISGEDHPQEREFEADVSSCARFQLSASNGGTAGWD